MSEDTTAKPGQRRRRTTRSGRRKPLRLPNADGDAASTPSAWPQTEAELASTTGQSALDSGELFDGVESGESEEAAEGESGCGSQPPEMSASELDDNDSSDTAELVVTPATRPAPQASDCQPVATTVLPSGSTT